MCSSEENRKIRIIIADDHAVVRTGLRLIFATTPDIVLAGECSNGQELIDQLKTAAYDIVILDISMPGRDSFDVMQHINTNHPGLPVIVFTMNNEEHYAIRMLRKGASAYLNKEVPPEELLNAIRTVAGGNKVYSPGQQHRLLEIATSRHDDHKPLHETLTDREFQILCMLAAGMRKSEIANELGISKNTISNHRTNIMQKMHFATNQDITRYAMEHNIC